MDSVVNWEVVCKVPHLPCTGHVKDVDMNILKKQAGIINFVAAEHHYTTYSTHCTYLTIKAIKVRLWTDQICFTWLLLRSTISFLAASARSLFRQTMWTVPPRNIQTLWLILNMRRINQVTLTKLSFTNRPLLAISRAAAFPIPLLQPVIRKDLPLTLTSKSAGEKCFAAAS